MRFINKIKAEEFNAEIDEFINKNWVEDEGGYRNIKYPMLRTPHREKIKFILYEEQNKYCCYCWHQLELNDSGSHGKSISIEHLIPQNTDRSEFEKYLAIAKINDYVEFRDSFDLKTKRAHFQKYPHDIAYYNLFASCSNYSHCNNGRGKEFIAPFLYDPDINLKYYISEDGKIRCEEIAGELYEALINALKLNERTLSNVRMVWRKFASSSFTYQEIESNLSNLSEWTVFITENFTHLVTIISDILTEPFFMKVNSYKAFYFLFKDNILKTE